MPAGKGSTCRRKSSLVRAQRAIAVGPPAPASTAINAMTTTLTKGCWRLMGERGSQRVEMSDDLVHRHAGKLGHDPSSVCFKTACHTENDLQTTASRRKPPYLARITQKYALALVFDPVRTGRARDGVGHRSIGCDAPERADAHGHRLWQGPRLSHDPGPQCRLHEGRRLCDHAESWSRVGRHRQGDAACAGQFSVNRSR